MNVIEADKIVRNPMKPEKQRDSLFSLLFISLVDKIISK
jgi:hypothetical protein